MSWLNKVKGAFIEMEDADAIPTKLSDKKLASTPVVQAYVHSAPVGSNAEIKEALSKELTEKLQGTSYLTFQKISSGMKLKIADPSTRVVATVSSLEAQGITKQSIIDGANSAVVFLQSEGANFQSELATGLATLESDHVTKSETIAQGLQAKQDQIKLLSEEISELQKEKMTLDQSVAQEKTNLEMQKIGFEGSLNSLIQEVTNDIFDITKYSGV